MDAISDPRVETVVVMSSAQVGKTEIVNNLCGYHIHQDPAPILVVQPSVEMGETWSKDRLAPMLRDSPGLRGKVSDAKSRTSGNTVRHKTFAGGHLTVTGANSAAGLASRPIRILCCDEVDRYDASAGTEGDPITLAIKRTATFWNRKVVLVSTPGVAGVSRIEKAYEESDKRRFWVPCPHCDEAQVMRWEQVRWDEGAPSTAAYHCAECGAAWTDAERWAAVRRGDWRAEAPFRGTAGFHLNELYSPWRRLVETVRDFLAAKGDPQRLKAWVNTALGETWREKGDAPEAERLYERSRGEEFPEGVLPKGALLLTAGADCQGDRIEARVWAWGPGFEQWLVAREIYMGSPAVWETWKGVQDLLARSFPAEDGGPDAVIARLAVDTGGRDTAAVYGHLRRLGQPQRVMPVKGGSNSGRPISLPSYVDAQDGARKLRRALRLWTINSGHWKAELYGRLRQARSEEGFPLGWVHLPSWIDAEECQQLVAEELVTVQTRQRFTRQEWRKLRERNEALDCAVYARAALSDLGADRKGDRFWLQYARAEPVAPGEAPADAPPLAARSATGRLFTPRARSGRRVTRSSAMG